MKLKKQKRIKTPLEKEQSFIKIGTNILLIVVFVAAVIIAFNNSFGNVDLSGTDSSSLSTLSLLAEKVDTSKLITNQLSDIDKPELIAKIKTSGLDLLTNDEFDHSKYSADAIHLTNNLTLSANDIGLIYSYLFVDNADKYNTVIYELSITTSGDTTIIKIVSSINFYNAFTSKIAATEDSDTISSIPKRVYLTNTITLANGTYSYSQVIFNNLSLDNSTQVSKLVDEANSSAKLNEHVPKLIINMIETLASKTGSTYSFNFNQLELKKTLN